jgi:cardiolipin synthase
MPPQQSDPSGSAELKESPVLQPRAHHTRPAGLRYCLTAHKLKPGNRLSVLVDGAEAYPAMLAAILGARHEVLLETYIFESDSAGRRFHHALCERALSGVSVRLIVDGAGSWGLSGGDRDALLDAGAHVATFHPVRPWRRRWGWSVRDHRKLLVVDEELAFTGGLNIADEYAPREWGGKGWHDVHVRVQGPAVADLRRLFFDSWRYASPDGVPRRTTHPRPARAQQTPREELVPAAAHAASAEEGRVQALSVGRFRDRRAIEKHLLRAVSLSQMRVFVYSAYFIPNRRWRKTLRRAAMRGVDVRVMVPHHSDVPGIVHASRYTYAALLRGRVRIFEYLPTMLHAKAIVVDGAWCTIGSYNLDQRSLQYNWEVALSIVDDDAAFTLEERFARDLVLCREIDPAEWRRRPLWQRIQERIFYYFRLWL